MGMLARWARRDLLRRGEGHLSQLRHRDDGYDGSTDQIREGLRAAMEVVRRLEPSPGLRTYLEAVDAALLREQGRLDGRGEDDRTTAGVATLRAELRNLPRRWVWRGLKAALFVGACLLLVWTWVRRG